MLPRRGRDARPLALGKASKHVGHYLWLLVVLAWLIGDADGAWEASVARAAREEQASER